MRRQIPVFVNKARRTICRVRGEAAEVDVDTQVWRNRWIRRLESLFDEAASNAMPQKKDGDSDTQTASPRERQMWSHVAGHLGQVMGNLSKGYDEREFNEDLAKLEKLVDEIGEFQAQSAGAESKVKDAKSEGEASS